MKYLNAIKLACHLLIQYWLIMNEGVVPADWGVSYIVNNQKVNTDVVMPGCGTTDEIFAVR